MSNTIFVWGMLVLASALGKPADEKLGAFFLTIGILADIWSALMEVFI